jgi:hypothetical protein
MEDKISSKEKQILQSLAEELKKTHNAKKVVISEVVYEIEEQNGSRSSYVIDDKIKS